MKEFERFRPDETVIDDMYAELVLDWNGLVTEIPDLSIDPPLMRNHDALDEDAEQDHLLFWPIGQDLLADVVRDALDMLQEDPEDPDESSVAGASKRLIIH